MLSERSHSKDLISPKSQHRYSLGNKMQTVVARGWEEGEQWIECGAFFWGEETVLELEVVGAQYCECTKCQ